MPTQSCLTNFLTDPWSGLKVLVPAAAVEILLHKNVWQQSSLRQLTLYLTMANVYWFATSFHSAFLETGLLMQVPSNDEKHQVDNARHRFGFLNKIEIVLGVATLDLFCEWRKRIVDHNGFVDTCLSSAVLAPALIVGAQTAYMLPRLDRGIKAILDGTTTREELERKDKPFVNVHRAYIGLDSVKLAGLAVAGLRFGKMLTV